MKKEFMFEAIKQAEKAYRIDEVPVGAVIVKNNKIISKAYNKIEKTKDATNHAEIIAIKKASKKVKNWRLIDCDLYVTLEPCEMCKGAIKNSRINNIFYIVSQDNYKNNTCTFNKFDIETTIYLNMLKNFFKEKRK